MANSGKIEEAIPLFKRSLEHGPNANTYYLLALAYQMLGKITSAEKNYQQAVSLYPQFSMAYNNLGALYLDQKKYDQAVADYQAAIRINPQYAEAYCNLGLVYAKHGKYEFCTRFGSPSDNACDVFLIIIYEW